jgi:hypothetical protein
VFMNRETFHGLLHDVCNAGYRICSPRNGASGCSTISDQGPGKSGEDAFVVIPWSPWIEILHCQSTKIVYRSFSVLRGSVPAQSDFAAFGLYPKFKAVGPDYYLLIISQHGSRQRRFYWFPRIVRELVVRRSCQGLRMRSLGETARLAVSLTQRKRFARA